MIITLSPAKILSFNKSMPDIQLSKPFFKEESDEIIQLLRELSPKDIRDLMGINQLQAETVFVYIQQFGSQAAPRQAAALAYNGMAYKGLDFESLSPKEREYAQNHILIESAIYGFLRPLDAINPYRLEMQAKLKNPKGNNLYDYWRDTLTNYLSNRLIDDDKIWIDLSSEEYTKAIHRAKLNPQITKITPLFKEETPKGLRQVIVHTKKARGVMARFIVQNQIEKPDDLKAFSEDGYCFAQHLSSETAPVFIR